jgi:pyrimidine-specific ribonucleoside hydrolase
MGDDPDATSEAAAETAAAASAPHAPSSAAYTGHIGDAGALCALVDPGALRIERRPVRVELSGFARGQTIVDRRRRVGEDAIHTSASGAASGSAGALPGATLVDVALDVDRARYARLFLDTIARLP